MALVNVEVTAKDETVRGSIDAIRRVVKGGAILIRVVATGEIFTLGDFSQMPENQKSLPAPLNPFEALRLAIQHSRGTSR